jgi:plasmid stabilization system protein ParE
MVRRIIWTSRAELVFSWILEFYFKRNGTKLYSHKLNDEIKKIIKLLLKHPYLGKKTEIENVHVLVKGDFKIFYKIEPEEIVILMVWDCRQDPDDLKIS